MLLLILFATTVLWSTVNCDETIGEERNTTVLEKLFKKKYMGEGRSKHIIQYLLNINIASIELGFG